MERKNKRLPFGEMKKIVGMCARLNLNRAMFSIIFFMLIYSMASSVVMAPMLLSVNENGEASLGGIIFTLLVAFALYVLIYMVFYGLNVIMARMVKKEYVTIGFLFVGFKQNKKNVFKGSLLFALINIFIGAIITLFLVIFSENVAAYIEKNGLIQAMEILMLIVVIVQLLVKLLFIFVWIEIYENPNTKIFRAFANSFKIMFGRFFRFIGFELYSAGYALIIFVLSIVAGSFISENYLLMSNIVGFLSLIAELIVAVRLFIALPVFYYSVTGKFKFNQEKSFDDSTLTGNNASVLIGSEEDAQDAEVVSTGEQDEE